MTSALQRTDRPCPTSRQSAPDIEPWPEQTRQHNTGSARRAGGPLIAGPHSHPCPEADCPGMECYRGRIEGCGHPTKTSGDYCPAGGTCRGWEAGA